MGAGRNSWRHRTACHNHTKIALSSKKRLDGGKKISPSS